MTAGIDKFTPTPEEQELFNKVFYQESDIDVKETEPQREGFSLSVALDSLKKWVRGRREKHGKPFGLTNNSAVEKLAAAGEELGLSTAFMMSLNLVMEEAVSNIIFYAYKGDVEDAVDISLVREGGELIVTLIDHGIAFDPTLRKDPDITLSAEDRPIGGLGIFLIKKIMDEVSYQRVDERNVFIMKKKITE